MNKHFFSILLILVLLLFLFLILKKTDHFFERYNPKLAPFLQPLKKNKNKLISRIRTIEKDTLYKRSDTTFTESQPICVLVEDFKYFIDNNISKIKSNTILKIVDHPFVSWCNSTFNYKNFLNNNNVKKVYAENWKDKLHPKLKIIPIGFESKSIVNKKENRLMKQISISQKKCKDKPIKILCNAHFLIHKNPVSGSYNQRQEVVDKLKNNKLVDFWDKKKTRKETWELHDNYSFELCPEGNGLDTHRFYEALLLNTIPIIKRNSLESMYINFPCVIIDDWNEISEEKCKKWKTQLQDRIENEKYKLKLDYWFK